MTLGREDLLARHKQSFSYQKSDRATGYVAKKQNNRFLVCVYFLDNSRLYLTGDLGELRKVLDGKQGFVKIHSWEKRAE